MDPTLTFELIDRHPALFSDAEAFAAKSDGKWIKHSAWEYNDYSRWFARHQHKQPSRMEHDPPDRDYNGREPKNNKKLTGCRSGK